MRTRTATVQRTDAEIRQAVMAALRADERVGADEIGVAVHVGVVTLTGNVETYARKLAAQAAAHRVAGVFDVASELVVHPSGSVSRTDGEVALAVRQALATHVLVPVDRIHSTVTDGIVTLRGNVEFQHEREEAERAVHQVDGVRGVVNQIGTNVATLTKEDMGMEPGMQRLHVTRSDEALQRAVLAELEWDPRVKATDIGVSVHLGVVTLTGAVHTYAERIAAQEAAHHVADVLDVANDLVVKLPGMLSRTDTEIAIAVRRALEWDVVVPHERIHSTVSDGVVALEGEIENWHEREAAERSVRNLVGVRAVANRLTIRAPEVDPDAVRAQIEDALERRAHRAVNRVNVSLNHGIVTLTGTVRTWAERRAIAGAARQTHGVYAVDDQLRIDPLV